MRRALPTALAACAILNLSAVAAGPFAQQPGASAAQGGRLATDVATGGRDQAAAAAPVEQKRSHRHRQPARVRPAGANSVTIKDFSFGPSSVTVQVGDTVSWSNSGPSQHTATAKDGSFDTGTLNKGQSGSHTFTKAGTFSYVCTIHPFMHGTVVVAAAAGSSSKPSSAPARAAAPTAPAPRKPGLPNTGVDVGSLLLSGVLMLGSGLVLRRRTARS
jgi:LPXTG-motif cell wall-anchored protein